MSRHILELGSDPRFNRRFQVGVARLTRSLSELQRRSDVVTSRRNKVRDSCSVPIVFSPEDQIRKRSIIFVIYHPDVGLIIRRHEAHREVIALHVPARRVNSPKPSDIKYGQKTLVMEVLAFRKYRAIQAREI